MKNKKQKTEELQARLPNSSRSLRILVFTRAQLPSSHVLETGGLTGMIIFNNNGSTFASDHTTFVRLLLAVCNFPNIYNYSNKNESPQVPSWRNGAALRSPSRALSPARGCICLQRRRVAAACCL